MTQDEQNIVNTVTEEVKKLISDNIKGFINDSELEQKVTPLIQKAIPKLKDLDEFKALQQELADMGLVIKSMEKRQDEQPRRKFSYYLEKAMQENSETMKNMINNRNLNTRMAFKVVGNMLESTLSGTVTFPAIEPSLIWPGDTPPAILSRCNVRPTSSVLIWYVQKKSREGTTAVQTEGSAKAQIDFVFDQDSSTAETIAAFSKVSKQMLADVYECQNEIQGEIAYQVNNLADTEVRGGGTLSGITSLASAYDIPNASMSVISPQISDYVKACIAQVWSNNFEPNAIFLNPLDIGGMLLEKDDDGSPLYPLGVNLLNVFPGIPIIPTNQITVGHIMCGDFRKAQVRILEGFNVNIGYDADDFTRNLVTILGEMRIHFWIPSNHVDAFVYDAFTDIKALLEKV